MPAEFELCSGNIHIILIALLVICISIFFFIELKKIKIRLDMIETKLQIDTKDTTSPSSFVEKMMNPMRNNNDFMTNNQPQPNNEKPNLPNNTTQMKPILFSNNNTVHENQQNKTVFQPIKQTQTQTQTQQQEMKSFMVNNIDNSSSSDLKVDVNKLNEEIKLKMEEDFKENDIEEGNRKEDNSTEDNFTDDNLTDDNLTDDDNSIQNMSDEDEIDINHILNDEDSDDEDSGDEGICDGETDTEVPDTEVADTEVPDTDNDDQLKQMTVNELKTILVDMKLPVSGNKTKLITRIIDNTK